MQLCGLGYLGLTVSDLDAWRTFGTDILGLAAVDGPAPSDDRVFLRMDERQWRIALQRGETDGLAQLGWEVPSPRAFEAGVAELDAAGVAVKVDRADLAAERGVAAVAQFADPAGHPCELFYGQRTEFTPFASPAGVSGFKTAGLGLGHVLVTVPDNGPVLDFYTSVLGHQVTDFIQMGGGKSAQFLHCTRRHHSIALFDLLPFSGLHHFMIEMATLDDVGLAYDRAIDAGCEIVNHLGRHTNDRMISFYVKAPTGPLVEVGWGAVEVDDATWVVTEFSGKGDLWGHRGSMMDAIADARTA
jgi:3,4-dihydroxy-9,10-secoandrosta-1,3,5(10)-triene-9,17-dione 4,5-dioxygenase